MADGSQLFNFKIAISQLRTDHFDCNLVGR